MTETPTDSTQIEPTPVADKPWELLMRTTNTRVALNAKPGSNAYSGWLAAIRAGITPSGELTATSRAGAFVAGLNPTQRSGVLRAAAIRAINKDVSHRPARNLGRSFAVLAAKEGSSSSIADQVAALPLMNRDAAALVLDGLIGRCARQGVAVDFEDLAATLAFWGTGVGSRSTDTRNRIVLDFYLGKPQSA